MIDDGVCVCVRDEESPGGRLESFLFVFYLFLLFCFRLVFCGWGGSLDKTPPPQQSR